MAPDMEGPRKTPDLQAILDELKARVEAKRRAGFYPADLEDRLSIHFRRIASQRNSSVREARAAVKALSEHVLDPAAISTTSSKPGGRLFHRLVAKLVSRQIKGTLDQVREHSKAMQALAALLIDALEETRAESRGQVEAILERLASYERTPADTPIALRDLRRRLEDLEASLHRQVDTAPGLADVLEGSGLPRTMFVDSAKWLAEKLVDAAPVLHLGASRGELIQVLQEAGVEAIGVEPDASLRKAASQAGLDLIAEDPLIRLRQTSHDSLGAVCATGYLEMVSLSEMAEIIELAFAKLRVGGRLVVTGLDPRGATPERVYRDPRRIRPVHPRVVEALSLEAGFSEVSTSSAPGPASDPMLNGTDYLTIATK